ncbi:MAG: TonB family protein [Acidobacteria bacterium]|nr:TonB family protein [Acidobacteriota bacterium]
MTDTVVADPVTYALGYALVRFLWQGAVIGLATAVALTLARRGSASLRYLMACAGLFAMAALPIVTFARALPWSGTTISANAGVPRALFATLVDDAPPVAGNPFELFSMLSALAWSPAIVIAWSAGVLLLAARLLVGWRTVAHLRAGAHAVDDGDWIARTTARVAGALGVERRVAVVRSASVDVPAVVGWMRPLIVVPMSAMAGLTPAQLEAIIAHEIAHIRRYDHVVNGVQTIVETLLFYHPSVWWVSRQIRIEREHCCDDIALSLGSTRVDYARALTSLEEARVPRPLLGISAADGSLVGRVRRVLGQSPQPVSRPRVALLIALAVTAVSAAIGASGAQMQAQGPSVVMAAQVVPEPPSAAATNTAQQALASADAQIVALEETYRRARLANDTATLTRLLDPAFVGVGSLDDIPRNKVESLAQWSGRRVTALATTSRERQMEDGAAIVRGVETMTVGGVTQQVRYARVWKVSPSVGWTLVSSIQVPASAGTARRAGMPPPPPPPAPSTGLASVRESITITGERPAGTASDRPAPPGPAVRIGEQGVTAPMKIKDVKPQYPWLARAAGVQGIVFLESIIDTDGSVTNLKVIRSSGSDELDGAAIDAVSQWRYTPTLLNGQPVSVICTMTVNFTLN